MRRELRVLSFPVCGADPSKLQRAPLPSSPGAESFGLFSCMINGEEQEQTHRAVFR